MKRIIFSLTFLLAIMAVHAQSQVKKSGGLPNDNLQRLQKVDSTIYRLFPTQNMWNFIKLNTRTGQMWQVQFDVEAPNRMQTVLFLDPLVTKDEESNGRFTLYSTQNMWTFILLDQIDGRVWQVQWAMESNNRGIVPIQ